MRRSTMILFAVLMPACLSDDSSTPTAPTPAPTPAPTTNPAIEAFLVGAEPDPVVVTETVTITVRTTAPHVEMMYARLHLTPPGEEVDEYDVPFQVGETEATITPFIGPFIRGVGYKAGEWKVKLHGLTDYIEYTDSPPVDFQVGSPSEITFTTVDPPASANIGGQRPVPVKVGESLSFNCWLLVPGSPSYTGQPLSYDTDIPIETTTPAGNSTVSTVTIPAGESSKRFAGSTATAGVWTYKILEDRLPEGVILGRYPSITVTVDP